MPNIETAAPGKHPAVSIEEAVDGRRVVCHTGTRKYFRLGLREAEFLASLDGQAEIDALRNGRRCGFSAAEVDKLLGWFAAHGLLADAQAPTVAPAGLLHRLIDFVTGPDKWRIHLVDPDAFLTRHRRLIDKLFTLPALFVYLVILMLPLAVPVSTADLLKLSVDGIGASQWLGMYVAMLGVIALHELAHAVTCKHFGGHVHKIGLMLLYLQPVVYCDVSDSWRFRERDKKIAVAVAGCFFQLLLSSLLYVAWSLLHVEALLIFAVINLAVALLNMLPFVKLDGYWVAVHLLDEPNLREKSFRAVMRLFSARLGPKPGARDLGAGLLAFGVSSVIATALFWGLGLHAIQKYVAKVSPELATGLLCMLLALGLYRFGKWMKSQWQSREDLQGERT